MRRIFMLLSIGAVFVATGCGSGGDATGQTKQSKPPATNDTNTEYVAADSKGIQTMTVRTTPIPEYLELSAHIEPDPTRVVHVYAPAGGRIVELRVRPWDKVERGQTLATLESSDLARAVADYHKALV